MKKPTTRELDAFYDALSPELKKLAQEHHPAAIWYAVQALKSHEPIEVENLLNANRKFVQEKEQEANNGLGKRVIDNFKKKL